MPTKKTAKKTVKKAAKKAAPKTQQKKPAKKLTVTLNSKDPVKNIECIMDKAVRDGFCKHCKCRETLHWDAHRVCFSTKDKN